MAVHILKDLPDLQALWLAFTMLERKPPIQLKLHSEGRVTLGRAPTHLDILSSPESHIFDFYFILNFFNCRCMSVLFSYMCITYMSRALRDRKKDTGSPGTGIHNYESPYGCWDLNSVPLEE